MSTSEPPAGTTPMIHRLDYGRQPTALVRWWRRLRGPARYLAVAALCFVCRGPIVRRTAQLYWQRQCLNLVRPFWPTGSFGDMPIEWERYLLATGLSDNIPTGKWRHLVFMGKMKRPDGAERIVVLQEEYRYNTGSVSTNTDVSMIARVIRPATVFQNAAWVGTAATGKPDRLQFHFQESWSSFSNLLPPNNDADLDGVAIDPQNASHLTIRATVIVDQSNRIMDVFLDNADVVQMKWRPVSTTKPTISSQPSGR